MYKKDRITIKENTISTKTITQRGIFYEYYTCDITTFKKENDTIHIQFTPMLIFGSNGKETARFSGVNQYYFEINKDVNDLYFEIYNGCIDCTNDFIGLIKFNKIKTETVINCGLYDDIKPKIIEVL